jgi:periplasmic protein TonB
MADTAIIAITGPYGGIDLKRNYRKYMTIAICIAIGIHFLLMGGYWLTWWMSQDDEPTIFIRTLKYSELGPPPSLQDQAAPAVAVSGPAVKPTIGIPIPVPDAEVSPEQTIATQTELSNIGAPTGDGAGTGAKIEQDINVNADDANKLKLDEAPADFVPYEKAPEPVKQIMPKYPDIALRAELEGTVYMKLWVTKEGKVKKAVIMKSDAEVFNQAAVDAAMQWVFTPALQQKKPVDVWVAVPFKFRLKDAQK